MMTIANIKVMMRTKPGGQNHILYNGSRTDVVDVVTHVVDEEVIHVLKSFLLCRIKIALRLTLSGVIAVHDLKPIYCSCAPPFILHPLKSRRLQKRIKTTWSKLPVIRFLDWIVEYMSNLV